MKEETKSRLDEIAIKEPPIYEIATFPKESEVVGVVNDISGEVLATLKFQHTGREKNPCKDCPFNNFNKNGITAYCDREIFGDGSLNKSFVNSFSELICSRVRIGYIPVVDNRMKGANEIMHYLRGKVVKKKIRKKIW